MSVAINGTPGPDVAGGIDASQQLVSDPVLVTAFSIMVVITLLANLLSVSYFVKSSITVMQPDALYILGLLIANLGIALVCQTMTAVIVSLGRWPFGQVGCQVFNYFRLVLENTVVWIMVVISYDKFQLLFFDYQWYVRAKRTPRVVVEIVLTFVFPIAFHIGGILLWLVMTTKEDRDEDYISDCLDHPYEVDIPFVMIGATVNIFIPGIVLTVISAAVFFQITRRIRRRKHIGHGLTANRNPGNQPGQSRRSPRQRHTPFPSRFLAKASAPTTRTVPRPRSDISGSSGHQDPVNKQDTSGYAWVANQGIVANRGVRDIEYRRFIRPAVTLAGLVAAFCICWFPVAIYYVYVHGFCPSCFDVTTQLWLQCLLYSNSAITPFIYSATNSKIRKFHARRARRVRSWCAQLHS